MTDLPIDKEPLPFKGIPNAYDFIPYSKLYYKLVEQRTVEEFGPHATLHQANKSMSLHGNVRFFKWFPDLFGTNKEELGKFYQRKFNLVAQNHFTDFVHGLTHIRSRSEHTNLGEALVVPDNLYMNGAPYPKYYDLNKGLKLSECKQSPYEQLGIGNARFPYLKVYNMSVRSRAYSFQREAFDLYHGIYKKDQIKADFPKEQPSVKFFTNPLNPYEDRLSHNVVRTIYMDEKFKMKSSQQKSFIHTPVSVSCTEHYSLVFTEAEEDHWIDKIHQGVKMKMGKTRLSSISGITTHKDTDAHKIADCTIKTLSELFL